MIKREKTRKNPKKWRLASLAASGGGVCGSRGVGGTTPHPPIGDACLYYAHCITMVLWSYGTMVVWYYGRKIFLGRTDTHHQRLSLQECTTIVTLQE